MKKLILITLIIFTTSLQANDCKPHLDEANKHKITGYKKDSAEQQNLYFSASSMQLGFYNECMFRKQNLKLNKIIEFLEFQSAQSFRNSDSSSSLSSQSSSNPTPTPSNQNYGTGY